MTNELSKRETASAGGSAQTLQIQVGRFYKCRDGGVTGRIELSPYPNKHVYPFRDSLFGSSYTSTGRYHTRLTTESDLISECNADGSPIDDELSGLSFAHDLAMKRIAELEADLHDSHCSQTRLKVSSDKLEAENIHLADFLQRQLEETTHWEKIADQRDGELRRLEAENQRLQAELDTTTKVWAEAEDDYNNTLKRVKELENEKGALRVELEEWKEPKPVVTSKWINIYPSGTVGGVGYKSRELVDNVSLGERRIAVLRLDTVNGVTTCHLESI